MVDPKIHKLCVEARDYLGCVKAMKGDPISTPKVILPARTSFTGNETFLPSKKIKKRRLEEVERIKKEENLVH